MSLITFAFLVAFSASTAVTGQAPRAIPYDPDRPILERLAVDDTLVIVKKNVVSHPPGPGNSSNPFQEEIKRLANYETIATVTVVAAHGALSDSGTWVRTRVESQSNEVIKGGGLFRQAGFVEFWHDGGQVQAESVTVVAGPYAKFVPGHRYLVFLRFDDHRQQTHPAFAFLVNTAGKLEPVADSDGGQAWTVPSTLVGRPLSEVVAALEASQ